MKSAQTKRSSSIFTPRPKSASRNTSAHTSRAASPIARSPRSPAPVQAHSWQLSPPRVTSWVPENGSYMAVAKPAKGQKSLVKANGDQPIKDRYIVVLAIPYGQTVAFQGIVDVCVLSGSATVCEHTVVPGSGWVRTYSPSSHPLLTIESNKLEDGTASFKFGAIDSDVDQVKALWEGAMGESSAVRASVIALRLVHCGMESIGTAAPPFRNLFKLASYSERKLDSLPKRAPKRKLALAADSPAVSKLKRSGSETSIAQSETATVDTGGYDSDESTVEEQLNETDESAAIEEELRSAIGLPNFYPVAFLTPDLQLLQTPRDWHETLDLVGAAVPQLNEEFHPISPVIVVAGGQNQG
ncbi:hypothetical protein FBU59_005188, partial [Linderina macrospora]